MSKNIVSELKKFVFAENGKHSTTRVEEFITASGKSIPVLINEYWTARQRQASSLHEVSYRACFKPQLPRFFIEKFTKPGDWVLDPFSGRGTTALEAALLCRNVVANDVNPLSAILCEPRLSPPDWQTVKLRLEEIPVKNSLRSDIDLSMFYEKQTLTEILSLKKYFNHRVELKKYDLTDAWIRMVATNRLTGHSPGFFSVYTLPPNQAASPKRQMKINADRKQVPEYRNTKEIILKKTKQLLKDLTPTQQANLAEAHDSSIFLTGDAASMKQVSDRQVALTVTSPPFLDVVQYASDNWLRCWFNELNASEIESGITMSKTLDQWSDKMARVFLELYRVTKPGGVVVFEVGEVRGGKVKLEEAVVKVGMDAGFICDCVMINEQDFTKTSNIWKVSNNSKGTNTNRIVVFRKD